MNRSVPLIGLVAMLLCAGLTQINFPSWMPTVIPAPENPGGPDLVTAFLKDPKELPQAISDAARFGDICLAMADFIEKDAERPEPRMKTGADMHNLCVISRDTEFEGRLLSSTYGSLGESIKTYMDKVTGTDGGKLDTAGRKKWAEGIRTVGKSAKYASEYLAWK